MIEVTVSFRANKAVLKEQGLLGAPVRLFTEKRFFVAPEAMGDLIALCEQRGWELSHRAVFTTSVAQIAAACEAEEWEEENVNG